MNYRKICLFSFIVLMFASRCMSATLEEEASGFVNDCAFNQSFTIESLQSNLGIKSVNFESNDMILLSSSWVKNNTGNLLQFAKTRININSQTHETNFYNNGKSLFPPPCDNCDIILISRSPNSKWELIEVNQSESKNGIWLLNEQRQFQVTDLDANYSYWIWSEDESLLWFEYILFPSASAQGLIILTELPPRVMEIEHQPNSKGKYYYTTGNAFSPTENVLLNVNGGGTTHITYDDDNLHIYNATQNGLHLIETQTIIGIEDVKWDEAIRDFLFIQVISGNLQITERNSKNIYKLSLDALGHTDIGPIPSESSTPYNLFEHYAISPDRRNIVVTSLSNLFIFECS